MATYNTAQQPIMSEPKKIARAQDNASALQSKAAQKTTRPQHTSMAFFKGTAAQFQKSSHKRSLLVDKIDQLINQLFAKLQVLTEQTMAPQQPIERSQACTSILEALAQHPSLSKVARNIQDILAVIDSLKQECLSIDSDYQMRIQAINDGQLPRDMLANNIIQKLISTNNTCIHRRDISTLITHADNLKNAPPAEQPDSMTKKLRSTLERLYQSEPSNYGRLLKEIINVHKMLNSKPQLSILQSDFRAASMSRYTAQQATINGLMQRYYRQLAAEYKIFADLFDGLKPAHQVQPHSPRRT